MKIRLHHILLPCMALLAIAGAAHAQESALPNIEAIEMAGGKSGEDKVVNAPTETETGYIPRSPGEPDSGYSPRSSSSTTLPAKSSTRKDSISTVIPPSLAPKVKTEKPGTPSKPSGEKSEENDSILSFNFLYYIIQKYKMQDIVD